MSEEPRILVLDLNPASGFGRGLQEILAINLPPAIYLPVETPPGSEFNIPSSSFSASLIFLVLPPNSLRQTMGLVQSLKGKPVIVVHGGFRILEMAELQKAGVSDFIIPPLEATDVLSRVWRLLEQRQAADPLTHSLKEMIGLRQLIGKSAPFLSEVEKIPLLAQCDVSVLISGEPGTGKELFARAIHYLSSRAGKPFMPTSCGAIPVELIENELFGHVRGAFTGAISPQPGLIHEANGGTLFLDEIDCFPLLAQAKILRFLQEKEYKKLGSCEVHHADVRVLAATNIDLEKAVKEGNFRQDLYYRLNVIPLRLPPLRKRREDIPVLAQYFLRRYASKFNKQVKDFTPEAYQNILLYEWPGNVRELENVVQRAVIFSKQTLIESGDFLLPLQAPASNRQSFQELKSRVIAQFEKNYIQGLLLAHHGNISKAAKAAQKDRRAFWELIRKHKIDLHNFKTNSL